MGVFVRYFVKFFYFFYYSSGFSSSSSSVTSKMAIETSEIMQTFNTSNETHTVARNISTLFAQAMAKTTVTTPTKIINTLFIWHHLPSLNIPTGKQFVCLFLDTMGYFCAIPIIIHTYRHILQRTLNAIIVNCNIYQINIPLHLNLMVRIPLLSSINAHGSSVSAQPCVRCAQPCSFHSQQNNAPYRLDCHSDENHQVIHI